MIRELDLIGTFPRSNASVDDIPDLEPLGDRLILKLQDAEMQTKGGILLTSGSQEKPVQGTVSKVGPGAWDEEKKAVKPMNVKVGQDVVYFKYAGDQMQDGEGNKYVVLHEADQEIDQGQFCSWLKRGRLTGDTTRRFLLVNAAAEGTPGLAQNGDPQTSGRKGAAHLMVTAFGQTDQTDAGRWVDVLPVGGVVKADIARNHWAIEHFRCLGDAVDSLGKLPHHLGMFGVTKVHAIGDRLRFCAHTGHVACRFSDSHGASRPRVEPAITRVAIGADR